MKNFEEMLKEIKSKRDGLKDPDKVIIKFFTELEKSAKLANRLQKSQEKLRKLYQQISDERESEIAEDEERFRVLLPISCFEDVDGITKINECIISSFPLYSDAMDFAKEMLEKTDKSDDYILDKVGVRLQKVIGKISSDDGIKILEEKEIKKGKDELIYISNLSSEMFSDITITKEDKNESKNNNRK